MSRECRSAPGADREASTGTCEKESNPETGCAQPAVVAQLQQPWPWQQSSTARNAASEDSVGVAAADDDWVCALAWWHGISGCAAGTAIAIDWRAQCLVSGQAILAIAIGPKAGATITSSRNLAVQRNIAAPA
jgi:hypothetical protein